MTETDRAITADLTDNIAWTDADIETYLKVMTTEIHQDNQCPCATTAETNRG